MEEKWNFISKLENYYRKAIFHSIQISYSIQILRNFGKNNLWYSFDNIQHLKISFPSIRKDRIGRNISLAIPLFNLLLKLIFPREFSSQKKSGIEGKQVFQEDRFQSFQTARLTPNRLGRSNSSNRYRTLQTLLVRFRSGARNFKAFHGSTPFIYLLSSTS